MLRASFLIRLGIAIVLGWYAYTFVQIPPTATFIPAGAATGVIVAIILGILAMLIVLAIFPRISPLLATFALVAITATRGTSESAILTLAIALATLSLVFIHEEHIPWRQRRLLEHVFKRH